MPLWMFDKIKAYLRVNEGSTIESSAPNKLVFVDAFGFRYELTIKSLGRNQLWIQKEEETLTKENLSQLDDLARKLKVQI